MTNHFYVTLPSNSSSHIFPDNRVTHFKTQLSSRISLQGEWEVSLAEVHYRNNFSTLPNNDFWIAFEFDLNKLPVITDNIEKEENNSDGSGGSDATSIVDPEGRGKIYFSGGCFSSIESLLRRISSNKAFKSIASISVFQSRIRITLKEHIKRLILSLSLQRVFNLLGVELNQSFIDGTDEFNLHACVPTQMFIYTDIIEPQHVGNVNAPLLRIVNIANSRDTLDSQAVNIFRHPHYIPLLKREFQEVEIDIRDDLGYYLPFTEGSLNVKLHFRQKTEPKN